MNFDTEYSKIREQLYKLGFDQPLPIGSLPIVTALLDDLIIQTSHLKKTKDANNKLLEVIMSIQTTTKKPFF